MSLTILTGRGAVAPAVTLRFASGATRVVDRLLVDAGTLTILGLSARGRVVVDYGTWTFGLTRCCDAANTVDEFGDDVCLACYGLRAQADTGEDAPVVTDRYTGFQD